MQMQLQKNAFALSFALFEVQVQMQMQFFAFAIAFALATVLTQNLQHNGCKKQQSEKQELLLEAKLELINQKTTPDRGVQKTEI